MSLVAQRVSVVTGNHLAYRYIASVLGSAFDTARYGGGGLGVLDEVVDDSSPHIIAIDSAQIGVMVVELVRKLKARHPRSSIIVIDHGSRDINASLLLASGMQALIPYDQLEDMLLQAIHCIDSGGIWFSSRYARASQSQTPRSIGSGDAALTPREFQVLELVSRRLSNKEIAGALDIQESTVKYHIANLFGKLQVSSRFALAAAAFTSTMDMLV
jgi:DNA-binding NarL/FixJ family response regulator